MDLDEGQGGGSWILDCIFFHVGMKMDGECEIREGLVLVAQQNGHLEPPKAAP